MKKAFKVHALVIGLLIASFPVGAQQDDPGPNAGVIPRYVSDKGYWVVEGNIHNKLEHTIHFYNNDGLRVYQQTISGRLKLNKRKTLMHIKRMLEIAVVAWEQRRPVNENLFAATK